MKVDPQNPSSWSRKWHQPGGYKELLTIAFPLMLSEFIYMATHAVDRLFLAHYDENALAAALPASILLINIIILPAMIIYYLTAFVAQYRGEQRLDEARESLSPGIWFSLLSYPFMLLLIPFSESIFLSAGHGIELVKGETTYLNILLVGSIFSFITWSLVAYFIGWGKTHWVTLASTLAMVVNVILDYLFIFDHGWIGGWGLEGAAWATNISILIEAVFLLVVVRYLPSEGRFTLKSLKYNRKAFWQLVKYGGPAGLESFFMFLGIFIFTLIVGKFGSQALALSNVGWTLNLMVLVPFVGLSSALTTLSGRYVGEKLTEKGVLVTHNAVRFLFMVSVLAFLPFFLVPEILLQIFNIEGQKAIAEGVFILHLVVAFTLGGAIDMIYAGTLKGAGDTLWPLYINIILTLVFMVPMLIVVDNFFTPSLTDYWVIFTFWLLLRGGVMALRFYQGRWKTMSVTQSN